MSVSWTRLEGSELWKNAKAVYDANGLAYHGFEHIIRLYEHAQALGIPYSLRLDENILGHDLVMSLGPVENERRSSVMLATMAGRDAKWTDPVLNTIEHRPSAGGDAALLALLDLADFIYPDVTRRNSELRRQEAMQVARASGRDFVQRDWVVGTTRYLAGLAERIAADLPSVKDAEFSDVWRRILNGIVNTCEVLPLKYDPRPDSLVQRYTLDQEACLKAIGTVPTGLPQEAIEAVIKAEHEVRQIHDLSSVSVKAENVIKALCKYGLISKSRPKTGIAASPVARNDRLALTDQGREWLNAINAPYPDYPQPVLQEDELCAVGQPG